MTCWLHMLGLHLLLLPTAPLAAGCPARCECSASTRTVACGRRRLTAIPEGIPAETRMLELSRNRIRCLNPGDLASLPTLEELDLNHNVIAHVEPGAFANLPRLRVLRLRGGALGGPFVFGAYFYPEQCLRGASTLRLSRPSSLLLHDLV